MVTGLRSRLRTSDLDTLHALPHLSQSLSLMTDWTGNTDLILRPSSLPSWNDCARRTAARLFGALINSAGFTLRSPPSSVGAAIGTAVHAGASSIMETKVQTGEGGSEKTAVECAISSLDERLGEDETLWDQTTPNRGHGQKQVERMVQTYARLIAPELKPTAVEERLHAKFGTTNITISGQKDVAIPNGLQDLKTGKRPSANGLQYGAYALLERSHGRRVDFIREDFLPRVPVSRPQMPPEVNSYDPTVCEQEAYNTITDVHHRMSLFMQNLGTGGNQPESVFPANPMSLLCDARFCPAHGTDFCRVHKGAK